MVHRTLARSEQTNSTAPETACCSPRLAAHAFDGFISPHATGDASGSTDFRVDPRANCRGVRHG